ncbi:MAG: hypothetical protein WBP31_09560 [Chitinophagales bacterium]|jgi:hypothetical protein|nr:hypothetical protein [Bacteroidota bacterium]MBK9556588.1 hypothetical protein [Bacteroidota bacterium]MBL0278920.1 hypothetical protein [Bacteroidota bacterium]
MSLIQKNNIEIITITVNPIYTSVILPIIGLFIGLLVLFGINKYSSFYVNKGEVILLAAVPNTEVKDTLTQQLYTYDTTSVWVYNDSGYVKLKTPEQIKGLRATYSSDVDFFRDYPSFMLWCLFILIQFAVWMFIICALPMGLHHLKVDNKFKLFKTGLFVSLLFFIVFLVLQTRTFYDSEPIRSDVFTSNLDNKILFATLIGSIAGAVCFAVMFTAVGILKENIAKDQTIEAQAIKLFNYSLSAASLILSLMVFSMSSLHTAYIDLLSRYYVKINLNYDIVYAYGLLYTLILLIFYVPLKLVSNNYIYFTDAKQLPAPGVNVVPDLQPNLVAPQLVPQNVVGIVKGPNNLKLFGDFIKGLTVSLSPFLASLIGNLLDKVFG